MAYRELKIFKEYFNIMALNIKQFMLMKLALN